MYEHRGMLLSDRASVGSARSRDKDKGLPGESRHIDGWTCTLDVP
jgi:hypothetical protein